MSLTAAPTASRPSPSGGGKATSDPAAAVAAWAVRCLLLELETWPKPGLVSHVDTGSHHDMDADTFHRSAAAIEPHFVAMVAAGQRCSGMGQLRTIGLEAETAMLAATGGVNTHRGAIFGLGLLCAAAGARASGAVSPSLSLGAVVTQLWGHEIINGPVTLHSNGQTVRRRYGAGGASSEAVQGFPSIYNVGLPALQLGRQLAPGDSEAARVQACFALIAVLEDTNLLHRGGSAGLGFAQTIAHAFIERGGVGRPAWGAQAHMVHQAFTARKLSPGGSADLLAMTLFVDALELSSAPHAGRCDR